MAIDSATLRALCTELSKKFKGARVEAFEQVDKWELVIRTRRDCFIVSCHPRSKRLMAAESKEDKISTHFSRTGDTLLKGTIVTGIHQKNLDRIAEIGFQKKDVVDRTSEYKLVVELVGSSGNALLLTSDNRVISTLRKTRRNAAGETYRPPRHPAWVDPTALSRAELVKVMLKDESASVGERIQKSIMGFSPLMSREVAYRCRLSPEKKVGECSPLELERVAEEAAKIYQHIVSETFMPGVYYRGKEALEVSCFTLSHLDELRMKSFASMNEAVTEFYSGSVEAERFQEMRGALLEAIGKRIRSKKALLEKQRNDLKEAGRYEKYKTMGDAVLMNLKRIRKGATQVSLRDPQEPGKRLKIILLPGKSPQEMAQECYKKYKKMKKALPLIMKRLDLSKAAIAELETLKKKVEHAASRADLDSLRRIVVGEGLQHVAPTKRKKAEKQYRTFTTSRGWQVMVGRSGKENDEITFHHARPRDLFFHSSSTAGSHTIMKVQGTGRVPSKRDIEEVASIAAYYSKARSSQLVPVAYTERRYVRKPRKAPPGTVLLDRERVVMVEPRKP